MSLWGCLIFGSCSLSIAWADGSYITARNDIATKLLLLSMLQKNP